jgi:regulator of replication initiation timing
MSDDYICKVCGHRAGDHAVGNICLVEGCNCKDDPYLEQLSLLTAERDTLQSQYNFLIVASQKLKIERDALAKQLEVARKAMQQTVNNAPIEHHFQAIKRAKDTLAEIEKEE